MHGMAEESDADRYVFVTLAACPKCHGRDLHTYRSSREVDGVTRYTACRGCNHRFIVAATFEDFSFQDLELRHDDDDTIARVNTTPDLHSIGQVAATARQCVPAIRTTATRLGIRPALKINGVPYFVGTDAARIVGAIAADSPSQTPPASAEGQRL